jgi:O-antigen/teichoic acid export membrane protein
MSELSSITQGFKRMEYQVYAEDITLNLLKLVLTVIFLIMGLGVVGAVLAHNISVAVAMGMLLLFVHRLFPLNRPLNPAKRNVRGMLGFTLPVYLTRVLSRFSGHIESLILGSLGLVSGVGVYTTALRLSGVGMLFHQSLQRIAMPMISELYSQGERKQLNRMYRTLTKWGLTFNLPIFLTIALFAEPLLSIFGSDFVAGASGLVILAFANLFNASTGVCGSMITMSGHSKLTFINSIEYLVINIALDIVLIPRWGVVGAALAVTLTEVTINILRTIQVLVLLGSWPYDRSYLKPLTASLLAGGAAYLVRHWTGFAPGLLQLLVGGVVLWVIYACVVIALRLSEEDRLVLNRLWARYRPGRS